MNDTWSPRGSLHFSRSVMSDSLWFHGPQHARPPCPSPTPGVYPTESVMPSNHLILSFPSPPAFNLSQHLGLFKRVSTSKGGQCIGVSTSASVHLVNIQDWFPLGLTGWIFLQTKGLQESSPTPQFKTINSSVLSFLYSQILTSTHDYWKNHSFH